MSAAELMHAIDTQLCHVWMVRAFLKHSDEATETPAEIGKPREQIRCKRNADKFERDEQQDPGC